MTGINHTPYVRMAWKKLAANDNVCVWLVKDLHEPYKALLSACASMGNGTINFTGEYRYKVQDWQVVKTGESTIYDFFLLHLMSAWLT